MAEHSIDGTRFANGPMLHSRLILAICLCLLTTAAASQVNSYWKVDEGVAHTTIRVPEAQKPNVFATLTVEYSIVGGTCRVMVGVAMLTGQGYGAARAHRKVEHDMTVTILGMHQWTAKPIVALYSNGVEAAIPASANLVDELKAGSTVQVKALPSAPTFEFSLRGSRAAIEKASTACG